MLLDLLRLNEIGEGMDVGKSLAESIEGATTATIGMAVAPRQGLRLMRDWSKRSSRHISPPMPEMTAARWIP